MPFSNPSIPTLESLASATFSKVIQTPGEEAVCVRSLQIRFPEATPNRLGEETLKKTYTVKPLVVSISGESVFGELAILDALERDGWSGVWVDTFHQNKFWDAMPYGQSVGLPSDAKAQFDRIVSENGGRTAGFFDIMAWHGGSFLFVEYKGPGDKSNKNEAAWIGAALRAGVSPAELLYISLGEL